MHICAWVVHINITMTNVCIFNQCVIQIVAAFTITQNKVTNTMHTFMLTFGSFLCWVKRVKHEFQELLPLLPCHAGLCINRALILAENVQEYQVMSCTIDAILYRSRPYRNVSVCKSRRYTLTCTLARKRAFCFKEKVARKSCSNSSFKGVTICIICSGL